MLHCVLLGLVIRRWTTSSLARLAMTGENVLLMVCLLLHLVFDDWLYANVRYIVLLVCMFVSE